MKNIKSRYTLLLVLTLGLAMAFTGSISHSKLASAACANTPNSSLGTDSMTVSIPSTGTYYIWTRLLDPDTTNNSVYMQVDGGCADEVGGSSNIPANTWTWINYQNGTSSQPINMSLTAGNHTVLLTGKGSGVGVDRILFLADQSCIPSGTGSNCTVTTYDPPTVSITAPNSGSTVTGSAVALSASANDDDSTISDVQFEVDGQVIGTDTTYPYSVNWNSTGVADGSHTLKVNATNADGQTTSSQETFTVANHTCSTAPTAPTGLTATATGLQTMSLSWSASTASSGCSISGYQVYRGGSLITTVTGTTSAESGLTADTAYQFYIKATDNGGHTSAASATVTGTTQADTTPPTAPTNVTATATSSSAVHLSWSASSDNVAVGGYRIYRNGTFYATVSATTTSYTDNDVAANTTYSYTISAIDTSNNESAKTATTPSSVHTPATADTTPPTAPTNLKSVLSTSSTVTLEWSASTDNVGVAGYHVYRGSTLVATVNTTSYTDSDLSPNTTYAYHVVAYDTSANLSAPSSTVNVTTQTGTVVTCSTGDLNADGKVNVLDLSILLSHWSSSSATSCQGDINGDHIVNVLDLSILLSHWSAGA